MAWQVPSSSTSSVDPEQLAEAKVQMEDRIQKLQSLFASKGMSLQATVKRVYKEDSEEGRARLAELQREKEEKFLKYVLSDPSEPLRYPEQGSMYQLIARCYEERRKLLVYGVENDRRDTLHIHPPLGEIANTVLASPTGTVDLAAFSQLLTRAGHTFTLEIEGATPDATLVPGIQFHDGVTVKMRNLTLKGSKYAVFSGDGSSLSPLSIHHDSFVECHSCIIEAGDERANPSYCVYVAESGAIRLHDCDVTSTNQEFAISLHEGTRMELVRTKVAGIFAHEPDSVTIKDSDIRGIPKISATGIFAYNPKGIEMVGSHFCDFRYTGCHIEAMTKPRPCIIKRNTISGNGEFGIESASTIATRSAWLGDNKVSNNAWGPIRMRQPKVIDVASQFDHKVSRLGRVRESLAGKFCDGCIDVKLELRKAERDGHSVEYYAATILSVKGAVLGTGTVPILTAAHQGVFWFGDAGVCELDAQDKLLGIRWDNGDYWAKQITEPAKKLANKEAVKMAEKLVKERKKAAQSRDSPAGPPADGGGFIVKETHGYGSASSASAAPAASLEDKQASASTPQLPAPEEQPLSPDAECVVCMSSQDDRPIDWIFSACGHRCLCKRCARKLRLFANSSSVECPMCRTVSEIVPMHAFKGERVFVSASG